MRKVAEVGCSEAEGNTVPFGFDSGGVLAIEDMLLFKETTSIFKTSLM
jgi:hypothetical protein